MCQLPGPIVYDGGRRWTDCADTSEEQEHHSVFVIENVKRHLKECFISACTAGWLKRQSCKRVGWSMPCFLQREEFQLSSAYHASLRLCDR